MPKLGANQLTKLEQVRLEGTVTRGFLVEQHHLSFHFKEGGEAVILKPNMDIAMVVHHLQDLVDRLRKRGGLR